MDFLPGGKEVRVQILLDSITTLSAAIACYQRGFLIAWWNHFGSEGGGSQDLVDFLIGMTDVNNGAKVEWESKWAWEEVVGGIWENEG